MFVILATVVYKRSSMRFTISFLAARRKRRLQYFIYSSLTRHPLLLSTFKAKPKRTGKGGGGE
jgi:hypothetical protein